MDVHVNNSLDLELATMPFYIMRIKTLNSTKSLYFTIRMKRARTGGHGVLIRMSVQTLATFGGFSLHSPFLPRSGCRHLASLVARQRQLTVAHLRRFAG